MIVAGTHSRVFNTTGEGNATPFPAGVGVGAVEIDVQVPVIRPMSTTT